MSKHCPPTYFLLCCKIVCSCVIRLCTSSSRGHNRTHFCLPCCQATPDYGCVLYLIFWTDAVLFKPSGRPSVEAVLTVSAIMRLFSAALSLALASTVAAQVKISSLPLKFRKFCQSVFAWTNWPLHRSPVPTMKDLARTRITHVLPLRASVECPVKETPQRGPRNAAFSLSTSRVSRPMEVIGMGFNLRFPFSSFQPRPALRLW